VRYVRSVAAARRLDASRILLVGESAGAWASLFLGYVDRAQQEGHSGNPGWSSSVAGIVSISGELKGQAYCSTLIAGLPVGCQINTDRDETNDVKGAGASFAQPPLLMLHGTKDLIVPYVNGKRVYERAQAVGLPSALITMEGAGHVPWDVIFTADVFSQTMQAIADGIDLAHAQPPPGCVPASKSRL
jgi:acetyl esterase/lipase